MFKRSTGNNTSSVEFGKTKEALNVKCRAFINSAPILFFEPRIDAKKIELNMINELEGETLIEIEYVIPATNSRYNFVFSFYKNEGTELDMLKRKRKADLN